MLRLLSTALVAVACLCFLGGKLHAQNYQRCPCSVSSGCNGSCQAGGAKQQYYVCPGSLIGTGPCAVSGETNTVPGHFTYKPQLVWVPNTGSAVTNGAAAVTETHSQHTVTTGRRFALLPRNRQHSTVKGSVQQRATPAPVPVPVPTPMPTKKPIAQLVPAQGHTHTCANGHTWDHTMDGGSHRCPFCGLSQFVVSNQRFVTPNTPAVQAAVTTTPSAQPYTLSSPGCANGQCQSATSRSRGLFFRR